MTTNWAYPISSEVSEIYRRCHVVYHYWMTVYRHVYSMFYRMTRRPALETYPISMVLQFDAMAVKETQNVYYSRTDTSDLLPALDLFSFLTQGAKHPVGISRRPFPPSLVTVHRKYESKGDKADRSLAISGRAAGRRN